MNKHVNCDFVQDLILDRSSAMREGNLEGHMADRSTASTSRVGRPRMRSAHQTPHVPKQTKVKVCT